MCIFKYGCSFLFLEHFKTFPEKKHHELSKTLNFLKFYKKVIYKIAELVNLQNCRIGKLTKLQNW